MSELEAPAVQLVFLDVQCIASRSDWRTDTSRSVFRDVTDDTAFNQKFHIEQGYRVFELVSEDTEANMRFVAKEVRLDVDRMPPEP